MATFIKLTSEHLEDHYVGFYEDLVYKIIVDQCVQRPFKEIIYEKIKRQLPAIVPFEKSNITKLELYVAKCDDNYTDVFLDWNENNDLCLVARVENLELYDVEKITNIFVNWLL